MLSNCGSRGGCVLINGFAALAVRQQVRLSVLYFVCTTRTRRRYMPHSLFASPWLGLPAMVGRLLGMVVELYVVWRHVDAMLGSDRGLPHSAPPAPSAAED
jgi:hypothetical protein